MNPRSSPRFWPEYSHIPELQFVRLEHWVQPRTGQGVGGLKWYEVWSTVLGIWYELSSDGLSGANTHVHLCTLRHIPSISQGCIYQTVILCNINQLSELTWVDAILLENQAQYRASCPLPPWCDNFRTLKPVLWTAHTYLLRWAKITPQADTQVTLALVVLTLGLHWIKILLWELVAMKHQTPAKCPCGRKARTCGVRWEASLLATHSCACCSGAFGVSAMKLYYQTRTWWVAHYTPLSRQAQGQPNLYWILKYKLSEIRSLGMYIKTQWQQLLPAEHVSGTLHSAIVIFPI